jgi:hypothetical protein
MPYTDLEALGVILIQCMTGSNETPEVNVVRDERSRNKLFGIPNSENWSQENELVDFLDELFDRKRPALGKVARPVSFGWIMSEIAKLIIQACVCVP